MAAEAFLDCRWVVTTIVRRGDLGSTGGGGQHLEASITHVP